MDIDRLRYFHVIAETGSFTEASRVLRISQPALSKAMRLLQSELGATLIQPSGRGIVITDRGRELAREAQDILERVARLKFSRQAQGAGRTEKFAIGSFEVFTTYFLGELLTHELAGRPVDVHELIPGQLEDAIAEGKVDLGISYHPIPHAELEMIQVASIEMGIFQKKGLHKQMSLDEASFVVPITPIRGAPTKVQGLDGWPDDRLPRKVLYRVGMMESALEICRRGLAVAYFPCFVVKLHNQIVKADQALVRLPFSSRALAPKQPVYLIKRKASVENEIMRKVARALRRLS